MSRIRSKNTSHERIVFRYLRENAISFRRHYKIASGSPDIALPEHKKAVFINGDFWHGRRYARTNGRLKPFWRKKITANISRDRRNYRKLKKEGWRILKVWTGDLDSKKSLILKRISDFLQLTE